MGHRNGAGDGRGSRPVRNGGEVLSRIFAPSSRMASVEAVLPESSAAMEWFGIALTARRCDPNDIGL
ncbi:hypothetical protein PSAB6_30372 [Paraburkholderia sabiae]|nr:hypothetical protein PSAB6_30372 [Paraburkholderia sabiae]